MKNLLKKTLSVFIAAAMILGVIPVTGFITGDPGIRENQLIANAASNPIAVSSSTSPGKIEFFFDCNADTYINGVKTDKFLLDVTVETDSAIDENEVVYVDVVVTLPDSLSFDNGEQVKTVSGTGLTSDGRKWTLPFDINVSNPMGLKDSEIMVDIYCKSELVGVTSVPVFHSYTETVLAYFMHTDGTYLNYKTSKNTDAKGNIFGFTYEYTDANGDAYYSRNIYTLTLNVDGEKSIYTCYYGSQIDVIYLNPPSKPGYSLAYWVDEDEDSPPDFMPAHDLILTARWTDNAFGETYTMHYDMNGGLPVEGYTYNVAFGDDVPYPPDPARAGYSFVGWTPGVPLTMPNCDFKVTAMWAVNHYTIDFIIDGDCFSSFSARYGDMIILPASPAKDGFKFIGWADDEGNIFTESFYMPAKSLTLTAVWTVEDSTDKYDIKIYSSSPNLHVGKEQEIRFALSIFDDNNNQLDSDGGYTIKIEDESILNLTESSASQMDHIAIFEGKSEGCTDVTFIENNTKTQKTISITVAEDCDYYRCYVLDQNDVTSISGVYVDNFNCTEKTNGTQEVTFDAYNTNYAYAIVEVYDKNGNFIKSEPLNPKTDNSGMEKVINSFKYVYIDLTDWTSPWYQKEKNSKHTPIDLGEIPVDGVIKITSDGKKSNIVTLYNAIDVFVKIVMFASSIDISQSAHTASVTELVKNILENLPQNAIKSLGSELSKNMLNGSTKDATTKVYETVFNVFEEFGINYKKILVELLKGMGYGSLDAIVTTLIPAWQIVTAVDDFTAIAWVLNDYYYFQHGSGEMKIYMVKHGFENMLVENGVSVSQGNYFSDSTVLDAYVVEDSDGLQMFPSSLGSSVIYNITLRENGKEIQPTDTIEVRIPVPNGMDGMKCMVYRFEDDGQKTFIPSYLDNGYLVFTTDHFSYYAIVEKFNFSITTPENRTINYMESIKLYANAVNLPKGYKIKWKVEGEGVSIKPSANGKTCTVTSTSTGNVVIKAYIVDSSGKIVTDENGKQVSDSEYFYSEANLWLRIVYFFKKLFGISMTTAQLFKCAL